MDILNIKADTQKIEIRHPGTGAPTGLVLEVTTMESDAVKRVNRRQMDKALRNRKQKLSAAEIETNVLERMAAAVVGWEWQGDAAWGGQKLECTPENVVTVLQTPWLRSQVEEVLNDEAGFFETSPTS